MAARLIGGAIVGLVLAYAGVLVLGLQWATFIPWGLAGLALGAVCRSRREALAAGAVYGFVLGFTFMVAGYSGADPVAGKLPFFAVIGAVSAVAGAVAAFVGWWRWHGWGRHAGT